MADRGFVARNAHELERLRRLVGRLTDEQLASRVNDDWTVAAVLGHVAFWDARQIFLLDKLERGEAFTESDVEPDDPSWINDTTRSFMHAIEPRAAAQLALRTAEQIDGRLAALPDDVVARTWPTDPSSLVNPLRAAHRGEHLDEIEAVFGLHPG